MLYAILASDLYGGLASNGEIPWYCKEDFEFYKKCTHGSPLIMGRKTWDTLPPAVRRRDCIVLSRNQLDIDATVVNTVEEALHEAGKRPKNTSVIGGSEIYRLFEPFCHTIIRTKIPLVFRCNKHFEIDTEKWFIFARSTLEGELFYPDREHKIDLRGHEMKLEVWRKR